MIHCIKALQNYFLISNIIFQAWRRLMALIFPCFVIIYTALVSLSFLKNSMALETIRNTRIRITQNACSSCDIYIYKTPKVLTILNFIMETARSAAQKLFPFSTIGCVILPIYIFSWRYLCKIWSERYVTKRFNWPQIRHNWACCRDICIYVKQVITDVWPLSQ